MNELEKPKSKYEVHFTLPGDWSNKNYEKKVIFSILVHLYKNKVTQATFTKAQIMKFYNQDNVVSPDTPTQVNLSYLNQLEIITDKILGITFKMHKEGKEWKGLLINGIYINRKTENLEVFLNPIIAKEFFELPLKSPKRKEGFTQ